MLYTIRTVLTPGIGMLALMLLATACDDSGDSAESGESAEPADAAESTVDSNSVTPVALPFAAISAITFDDAGTLYLGDSGTGEVYALTPPEVVNAAADQGYNLRNIDTAVAELLGTTRESVRVRDMAVHPTTKEAYLAVARETEDDYASAIVIFDQTGAARLLDTELETQTLTVPFAPNESFFFYEDFPSRDLSFTDLEVHDGTLYIAGMSNADFASSLWTSSLPFSDEPSVTTVEIYHGVHAQYETRAPIRGMTVVELAGEDYLVATYTCTPLVVIPLSDIQDGAAITGKTIGELGYGNTPGDLVAVDVADESGNPVPLLFVQNKSQSAQIIPMAAVAEAAAGEGITTPLGLSVVDLGASNAPMVGLLQLADQDPAHLVSVRRDPEQGDLELVSFLKGVWFRLSDFQSEYEIPSYEYPADQDGIRQFQNMMKVDEGYPELVVE